MLHLNEVIEEYAKLLFEPLAAFHSKKIKNVQQGYTTQESAFLFSVMVEQPHGNFLCCIDSCK